MIFNQPPFFPELGNLMWHNWDISAVASIHPPIKDYNEPACDRVYSGFVLWSFRRTGLQTRGNW
jgi:hypothetical protein